MNFDALSADHSEVVSAVLHVTTECACLNR